MTLSILDCLSRLRPLIHTNTSDRGNELARDRVLEKVLKPVGYFADSYSPCQRDRD